MNKVHICIHGQGVMHLFLQPLSTSFKDFDIVYIWVIWKSDFFGAISPAETDTGLGRQLPGSVPHSKYLSRAARCPEIGT